MFTKLFIPTGQKALIIDDRMNGRERFAYDPERLAREAYRMSMYRNVQCPGSQRKPLGPKFA